MKKRYVQKMTTILLTAAMICSSVPVTAETVSENETVVEMETVDNTQNDSAENEQTGEDINKEGAYAGEYGDSDIEENRGDMDADYEQEDTKVEDGTEGSLSYSIYQKPNGIKYVIITDCDKSAEGVIEIPEKMKGIVVTGIGNSAFLGCNGLKDVYYTGTQEQWKAISFGNDEDDASDVFYYYDGDLGKYVPIPYTLHCNSSELTPSATPSVTPSEQPSAAPSATPSQQPSTAPSASPSKTPEADVPAAGTILKEKTGRGYQVTETDSSESKPTVTITKLFAKDKKAKKVTIPKTVTVDNVEYQVTGIAAKAFKNSNII